MTVTKVTVPGITSSINPDYAEVIAVADFDRQDPANRERERIWLNARSTLLTAGEVPMVMGLVRGAPRLWYEKVGLLERRSLDDVEYAQMGHALESTNAELFSKKTARQVQRAQVLVRSTRYPWLGCTLDYLQWLDPEQVGPLELKSTGNKENWPDDGEPCLKYQAQLQTQMIVLGSTFGSLSAIIGAPYFHHRWLDYRPHPDFESLMLARTERFWQSVQTRTEPPVDDEPDTTHALRHLALDVLADRVVALPAITLEWLDAWQKSKEAVAIWKRNQTYHENLLMTALGTAQKGLLPRGAGELTLKPYARKAYSVPETQTRRLNWVKP